MVSDIYYGEISDDWKVSWGKMEDASPYDVLSEMTKISIDGWDFLRCAKKYFYDEIQVDWGSFAYKAKKQDLEIFNKEKKCHIEGLDKLDPEKEYGVVFIEGV